MRAVAAEGVAEPSSRGQFEVIVLMPTWPAGAVLFNVWPMLRRTAKRREGFALVLGARHLEVCRLRRVIESRMVDASPTRGSNGQ